MDEKSRRVGRMFNRIASRYDLLNHLLSAGSDFYWRRAALNAMDPGTDSRLLDVCVGTGDLALGAMRRKVAPARVIGVDLALGMMRIGQTKTSPAGRSDVSYICGNAEDLPFKNQEFDGAMVAFGVRNLSDIPIGLENFYRVLKPGARLVVLELSRPTIVGFRNVFQFYFRHLLPQLGGLISGDGNAYRYLHSSVMAFPERERFLELMTDAGFINREYRDLSLGIATLFTGERPAGKTPEDEMEMTCANTL